jgi:peptidoglycan-N-acetylglucosamine deacetylase
MTVTVATAVLLAAALVGLLYIAPQVFRMFQVWRWNRRKGVLALTYDDGPDPVTTPALLDLLDELDAPATFYLTGFRAERCPEVISRLRDSRHELGTHAYSHWHAWRTSPFRELRDAMAAYQTLSETVPSNGPFRPPFGKISLLTLVAMWRRGRRVEWWSVATNDTADHFEDPISVATSILDQGKVVALMHCHHDEPHRRAFMLSVTRALVEEARRRGIQLVTMHSLAGHVSSRDR